MNLLPSCRDVRALASELEEGALPLGRRLGIRIHLLFCGACRAFLAGLRALPALSRRALAPPVNAPPEAEAALDAALKRIREGGHS